MPKGESLWPLFGEAFLFHIFFFFVGFLATKITGCYLKSWDKLVFFVFLFLDFIRPFLRSAKQASFLCSRLSKRLDFIRPFLRSAEQASFLCSRLTKTFIFVFDTVLQIFEPFQVFDICGFCFYLFSLAVEFFINHFGIFFHLTV